MQKIGDFKEKRDISTISTSSKILKDKDFQSLKKLYDKIKKRYNLSASGIINKIQKELIIPCSIFSKDLSPLETISKYLKENLELSFKEIAKLTNRSQKTIWQAYKNAVKKLPAKLEPEETKYNIPVSVLRTELSVLEAIVVHLKDQFNLSYHKIGELLERNERTVWTVYNRAMMKRKHEKI